MNALLKKNIECLKPMDTTIFSKISEKMGLSGFSAPKPKINFKNIVEKKVGKKKLHRLLENEISFEAANVLKLGKDLLSPYL